MFNFSEFHYFDLYRSRYIEHAPALMETAFSYKSIALKPIRVLKYALQEKLLLYIVLVKYSINEPLHTLRVLVSTHINPLQLNLWVAIQLFL